VCFKRLAGVRCVYEVAAAKDDYAALRLLVLPWTRRVMFKKNALVVKKAENVSAGREISGKRGSGQ